MTTRATLTGPTTPYTTRLRLRMPAASVPMWESIDVVSAELAGRTSLCSLQYICPYPRSLLLRRLTCMKDPSGASRDLIRVLVADSNQTQSQLLSRALRRQPGLKVTCCRSELSDCLQALRSAPADIVLLGDSPADHDHLIETLRDLRVNHPRLGLILLLDTYDRNLVVNAMRSGVRGLFCRASQQFRALCRCIAVVHQGTVLGEHRADGLHHRRAHLLSFNTHHQCQRRWSSKSTRGTGRQPGRRRDWQPRSRAAARHKREHGKKSAAADLR